MKTDNELKAKKKKKRAGSGQVLGTWRDEEERLQLLMKWEPPKGLIIFLDQNKLGLPELQIQVS